MSYELNKIMEDIKKDKRISLEHLKYLAEEFDERFWKSFRNLLSYGVKKYHFIPSNRIVWIVIGKGRDYLILSDLYCNCEDFYVKVVVQKSAKICYHLLAKLLADSFNYYEEIHVEDERFEQLMKDWKRF